MVRGKSVDLEKVRGNGEGDGGVRHGGLLVRYTQAVMEGDPASIEETRAELEREIGSKGIVDTAAVIAVFNVVDRVADATGIPVDETTREIRYGVGEELGMTHLTPEARSVR
jgi:hypothetical protein